MPIKLEELENFYAVAHLAPGSAIPAWAEGGEFVSISRTHDELSIVCEQDRVPEHIQCARDWCCLRFVGPFAFEETGIALSVIQPLSESGISIFLVSTFNTDYLLVKSKDLNATKDRLGSVGHIFV